MGTTKRKRFKGVDKKSQVEQPNPKRAKEQKAQFIRHVFNQYVSLQKFHFKWYHLSDICTNINSYFYIDDSIAIKEEDLKIHVFRQQSFKLLFGQGQNSSNDLGIHRADYSLYNNHNHKKIYVYQTTPKGSSPKNMVQDFSTVVEKGPARVNPSERRHVTGFGNISALISLLGLTESGKYSGFVETLELKSEPMTRSDDQASQTSCVSMMDMSLNAIGSNTPQHDDDDDMTLS
jgi:hypothetical protein